MPEIPLNFFLGKAIGRVSSRNGGSGQGSEEDRKGWAHTGGCHLHSQQLCLGLEAQDSHVWAGPPSVTPGTTPLVSTRGRI